MPKSGLVWLDSDIRSTCWFGVVCLGGFAPFKNDHAGPGEDHSWVAFFGSRQAGMIPWERPCKTVAGAKALVEDAARAWMLQVAEAVNAEA
jgi:hypothetical protein